MAQNGDTLDDSQPIPGLANLEQDVSPQFLTGLRKKIYRRTTANQMVAFSWNLPRVIFLELLTLIAHLLSSAKGGKSNS